MQTLPTRRFEKSRPCITRIRRLSRIETAMVVALTFTVPAIAGESNPSYVEFDVPGASGTIPAEINVGGTVFGNYSDAVGVHAFVRSRDGAFTTFDVPHSAPCGDDPTVSPTYVQGANNYGLATGPTVGVFFDDNCVSHGFLRQPDGEFSTFDPPGAGTMADTGTEADSINPFGLISGDYVDENFVSHGYLRTPSGKFVVFDAPGAGTGAGQGTVVDGFYGLTVSGELSGNLSDSNGIAHGYIRTADGNITVFDAPGAAQGTLTSSINVEGTIVGEFFDSNSVGHGFVRTQDGKLVTFDAPDAGTAAGQGTFPATNNDLGETVGFYVDNQFLVHGFIRTAECEIKTFDVPGSPATLPLAINLEGTITGYFYDQNGATHGFIVGK